jgi:hypothetical protein
MLRPDLFRAVPLPALRDRIADEKKLRVGIVLHALIQKLGAVLPASVQSWRWFDGGVRAGLGGESADGDQSKCRSRGAKSGSDHSADS